jgi:hypothetical protein
VISLAEEEEPLTDGSLLGTVEGAVNEPKRVVVMEGFWWMFSMKKGFQLSQSSRMNALLFDTCIGKKLTKRENGWMRLIYPARALNDLKAGGAVIALINQWNASLPLPIPST